MMYDELVKRLREVEEMLRVVQFNEAKSLIKEASNVIEELVKIREEQRASIVVLAGELAETQKLLFDGDKPRWIPVTERLPEETGKYLVCGQWSGKPAETWVCELIAFGQIKGWANEARNPVVTHWMPLPEPPKEERAWKNT